MKRANSLSVLNGNPRLVEQVNCFFFIPFICNLQINQYNKFLINMIMTCFPDTTKSNVEFSHSEHRYAPTREGLTDDFTTHY